MLGNLLNFIDTVLESELYLVNNEKLTFVVVIFLCVISILRGWNGLGRGGGLEHKQCGKQDSKIITAKVRRKTILEG